MENTEYAKRISHELLYRLADSNDFDSDLNTYIKLEMKEGYQLTITELYKRVYTCGGRYVPSKSHVTGYKVYSTKTGEAKYFKSLESLGRAIAGHIV